jgi:hypothetical protein
MMVFWAMELSAVYEPPHLAMALNVFFMLPVVLLVAYQVGRGFLLRGNPGLLWLDRSVCWSTDAPVGS